MTPISSHIKHLPLGILIGLTLAVAFSLFSFSEPMQAPPGCTSGTPGCDVPLNVGITGQSKGGWLRSTKLFVGDPPTASEQDGAITGDGYFRTTMGAILNTGGAGTGLIVQSGNVGIGTVSPGLKLTIDGGDIGIPTPGTGLILASIDGPGCQKVTVKVTGELVFTSVNCATGSSGSCLTGYRDSDLDTYTIGGGVTLCVASLPSGWRSSPSASDCNDNDVTRWRLRYADSDGDGYGVSSATCVGDHAGYIDNNTDCYDSNSNARPGQTSCFTSHRGDGSFDYDCIGGTTACHQFFRTANNTAATCDEATACGVGGANQCNYGFGNACCGEGGTTDCR